MKRTISEKAAACLGGRSTKFYERHDGRFGVRVNCYLTFRCNLDCEYCTNKYLNGEFPCSDEMNFEEWVKAIEKFDLPIMHIYFTGGEPTLHPDFSKILNYFLEKDYSVTLFTNLTNYRIKELITTDHFCIHTTRHAGRSKDKFEKRLDKLSDYPVQCFEFQGDKQIERSVAVNIISAERCLNEVKFCIGPDGKSHYSKRELLESYSQ